MEGAAPMIGRNAKKTIDDALSTTDNPERYCAQFRRKHSIRNRKGRQMLALLQLCGCSAAEVNRAVLERVSRKLINKIPKTNPEELEKLYEMTFPCITVPQLRAISCAVLARVKHIDPEDLKDLAPAADNTGEVSLKQQPYADLPHNVKQKIWHLVPHVFAEEVNIVLQEVIKVRSDRPLEDLAKIKSEEERKTLRNQNSLLRRVLELARDSRGKIDPALLHRVVEAIIERCEDPKKVGTRSNLLSYANLFADLLLEAQGRVHFVSEHQYPVLQFGMKAAQVLRKAYSERLNKRIHRGLKSLASCCTKGGEGLITTILLLCSDMARDAIPRLIVTRLRDIAIKRNGDVQGFQDDAVTQLTTLAWSALQVEKVLDTKALGHMSSGELKGLFGFFYIVLGAVTYEDYMWNAQLALMKDRNAAHPNLEAYLRQGSLQRRIFAAYGLEMYREGDVLAVSRFRQHFDTLARSTEQLLEDREKEIGRKLFTALEDE